MLNYLKITNENIANIFNTVEDFHELIKKSMFIPEKNIKYNDILEGCTIKMNPGFMMVSPYNIIPLIPVCVVNKDTKKYNIFVDKNVYENEELFHFAIQHEMGHVKQNRDNNIFHKFNKWKYEKYHNVSSSKNIKDLEKHQLGFDIDADLYALNYLKNNFSRDFIERSINSLKEFLEVKNEDIVEYGKNMSKWNKKYYSHLFPSKNIEAFLDKIFESTVNTMEKSISYNNKRIEILLNKI